MEHAHHVEHVEDGSKVFGFWIYIMTDLIIFGVLFATYLVLRDNTFGGPSGKELFHMSSVIKETLILLTSSLTCSLAMISVHNGHKKSALLWFTATFALGATFLALELIGFGHYIAQGASWQRSGFLSSYFTLVGTHGFHIFIGLLWMIVEMVRIVLRPLGHFSISRIERMALFWHFLDFVWIFIFTVVYGMGHLL